MSIAIETYRSHQKRVPKVTSASPGLQFEVGFWRNQSISRIEQAPGPRGSPQLPQAPTEDDALAELLADMAKTESCCVSFLLWHLGHAALLVP
jgi:hypothetical protein